jgi:hypothetical protein
VKEAGKDERTRNKHTMSLSIKAEVTGREAGFDPDRQHTPQMYLARASKTRSTLITIITRPTTIRKENTIWPKLKAEQRTTEFTQSS